ncbi:hypothetical protein [Paraflavitalea speifideaquila]|uniref:hypothetical protein n=1 Tax=Paraflavitalea speifideaquila TaxID=3076558 RepID=UPI0028E70E1D|nr:hypothetical protein [Paraflavitalea speifideiaquila]
MNTSNKNKVAIVYPAVSLSLLLLFSLLASAQRIKYNFNAGWKLQVGDMPGAEAAGYDDAT